MDFNKKNHLFDKNERILLAVSGGADSVAMTHLFMSLSLKVGIAHCNFQLRDEESDSDENFVKQLAGSLELPFFCKRFETTQTAEKQKISIQVAARNLRYDWLEKIRATNGYHYIATAHHMDDSLETFLINLVRGTGIHGLAGIPLKNGNIIRPMLCFSRDEIMQFLHSQNIFYREDSSNHSDKYTRNLIRHQVTPVLKQINPSLLQSFGNVTDVISQSVELQKDYIKNVKKSVCEYISDDRIEVDIHQLNEYPATGLILYHMLSEFGFSGNEVKNIAEVLQGEPGKIFYSQTHQCLLDRGKLIIVKINTDNGKNEILIHEKDTKVCFGRGQIDMRKIKSDQFSGFSGTEEEVFLDFSKLKFPLKIRKPKNGDYFHPLGMSGKKKLSDFFIDNKIPLVDKHEILLLESDGKVAWVIGYRIGHHFRIGKQTTDILHLKYKENRS